MKPRNFNTIDIDLEREVVRKSSTKIDKLEGEILFYVNSPDQIKKLMPRLYRYSENFSWYEMEYLDLLPLTELVNSKELSAKDWAQIFFSINEVYCKFNETGQKTDYATLYRLFIKKALDRIYEIENKELKNIFFEGCILNGKKHRSLGSLLIENSGVLFKTPPEIAVLHGDFCFSNIMISKDLQTIKLIDPRGGFDGPSIYGPRAYDIAKLCQSSYSWYDKIIEGYYELTRSDSGYGLRVIGHDWSTRSQSAFNQMLETFGLTKYDAKRLAGLMIAGTPALHLDDQNRAVAFALNAVLLLSG
jgi:hypothetical protein